MKYIGKILPAEGYAVRLKEKPPIDYMKSLTHLYQPLLGMESIMLYQTLLHEIELQTESTLQTHHTLMNYLNIPLDKIYEARLKLEGIGLLKTYRNTQHENPFYIYELQSPFSPIEFLYDAMLSELLYHHIGTAKYESLMNYYRQDKPAETEADITASFREVFTTFTPTMDSPNHFVKREDEKGPVVQEIDFSWIEMMLQQRMIPVKAILTTRNKKIISEMMFLYDLATNEIEKSLLWALTDENKLDIEEFKIACHDVFKTKYNQVPIELMPKKQEKVPEQPERKPVTKEEKLIQHLETVSPKQLLEDLSGGNRASEQDMRVVREVMTGQGLPPPVMNVLIHYVLLQSNMKLSKAYLEKIASHWSRANLRNAQEAMEFAKKEIEQFKTGAKGGGYRQQASKEIIPDWFIERDKKPSQLATPEPANESDQEKEEIDALLRQFAGE
ncbi:MAG TPA: DnaD domain protein [Virgibacillus sp.]|nr:DnaD domain protein [Virgibacillus sp.]